MLITCQWELQSREDRLTWTRWKTCRHLTIFGWRRTKKVTHWCRREWKLSKRIWDSITLIHRERTDVRTYVGSFSEAGIQFVGRRGGKDILHHANSQPSTLRSRGHHWAHPNFTTTMEALPWPAGHHDWLRHWVIWHERNRGCWIMITHSSLSTSGLKRIQHISTINR